MASAFWCQKAHLIILFLFWITFIIYSSERIKSKKLLNNYSSWIERGKDKERK